MFISVSLASIAMGDTSARKASLPHLQPIRKPNKSNLNNDTLVTDEKVHSRESSSDETTPRSKRMISQQMKPKAVTTLGHYPNPEQIRAHINRSVIDSQHPPAFSVAKRRGILQQLVPFDASPSKVNHRYIIHHVQNQHPVTIFHPGD